jgi:NAD(P)-dependent dehydrogenase (short-subunit alcohol dehydrogenase family)
VIALSLAAQTWSPSNEAPRPVTAGVGPKKAGGGRWPGSCTALSGNAFYAATKAEVVILTRRFALELGPYGKGFAQCNALIRLSRRGPF